MLTGLTIEKDVNNRTLIFATPEAKKQHSKTISLVYEAVDVSMVEEFLTNVGIDRVLLDEDHARSKARKAIGSYPPIKLKELYNCTENVYTREEVAHVYNIQYLQENCGLSMFDALICADDDGFWFTVFPDTAHTCAILSGRPSLKGNPEAVQQAIPIRRRHIVELNTLSGLMEVLSYHPDEYTIEAPKGAVPKSVTNHFQRATKYLEKTINKKYKEDDADHFLSQESEKFDFNWLKKKADLNFLNSASIELASQAFLRIFEVRSIFFSYNPDPN